MVSLLFGQFFGEEKTIIINRSNIFGKFFFFFIQYGLNMSIVDKSLVDESQSGDYNGTLA